MLALMSFLLSHSVHSVRLSVPWFLATESLHSDVRYRSVKLTPNEESRNIRCVGVLPRE